VVEEIGAAIEEDVEDDADRIAAARRLDGEAGVDVARAADGGDDAEVGVDAEREMIEIAQAELGDVDGRVVEGGAQAALAVAPGQKGAEALERMLAIFVTDAEADGVAEAPEERAEGKQEDLRQEAPASLRRQIEAPVAALAGGGIGRRVDPLVGGVRAG